MHLELPRAAFVWAQQHQGPCVGWTPAPQVDTNQLLWVDTNPAPSNSDDSAGKTLPAVRDMAGTAEQGFVPSAG